MSHYCAIYNTMALNFFKSWTSGSSRSDNNAPFFKVNTVSQTSYNTNHALYDEIRPEFLPQAVDALVFTKLKLKPGVSSVVELASGTGKFTKSLVARGFNQNHRLVAIEPSDGMIETFRKNFPRGPRVVRASSYYLPLEDASVDAVLVAQGFHWFADQQALKELARVLARPGGQLGLVWNYDDLRGLPASNWQVRVTEHVWTFDGGVPQYRHQRWRTALANQPYFAADLQEEHFLYEVHIRREDVWPYWRSRSFITALPADEQDQIRAFIEAVLAEPIAPEDLAPDGKLIARRGTHIVSTVRL